MYLQEKLKSPLVSIVSLSFFLMPGNALAITRIVDADDPDAFSNIQSAINVSSSGDIVFVRCGFYQENITMVNGVDVLGESPECVIIDGGSLDAVVKFKNIGSSTELSGFTIQNGRSVSGGGIRILGNDFSTGPIISRNFIIGNETVIGAPIYSGTGGGIYSYDSYPTISNNLIYGNIAEYSGGGVGVIDFGVILNSNTIVGNSVYRIGAPSYGGAIYSRRASVYPTSNIIYGNTATFSYGGAFDLISSCWQITNNDEFDNVPILPNLNSTGGCPGNIWSSLFFDPGFLNPTETHNLCLQSTSPLLDAGPMAGTTDLVDFFGRPRHLDGDFDGLTRVDMGYCEGGDITNVSVGPGSVLDWDASVNVSATFNLYRGLLSELIASCATDCVYTQDPVLVPQAQKDCGLTTTTFAYTGDPDPPIGDAFFYLITGEDFAEGTLGFRRNGMERNNHNPCP